MDPMGYGSSATRARHMSLFPLSLDATESFRLVGLVLLVAVLCFLVQWA